MFVITVLQAVIHTRFVGMFTIYICTKFYEPSSNGLLVIGIKLKAKF
jgi:hypothetical protein